DPVRGDRPADHAGDAGRARRPVVRADLDGDGDVRSAGPIGVRVSGGGGDGVVRGGGGALVAAAGDLIRGGRAGRRRRGREGGGAVAAGDVHRDRRGAPCAARIAGRGG